MALVAEIVVLTFGSSLLAFAAVVARRPELAGRFLSGFASSARTHYLEQVLRLVAGWALVSFSPSMAHATFFEILGWAISVTAVGLLLVPWRWHRRFGRWVVPLVVRRLRLFGLVAGMLGAFVLWGVIRSRLG